MYCRECGRQVPVDAKFCPVCGADQSGLRSSPKGIATPWIILALVLMPPLGVALMFTSSRWSDDTKWFVAGLFFTPLWSRFLWQRQWSPAIKYGLLAAFMAAYFVAVLAFTSLQPAVWVSILTIIVLFFVLRSQGAQPRGTASAADDQTALRRAVQAKLDTCHDLIAEIEQHTVFELVPMDSAAHRHYLAALEARAEAMDLFDHAATGADLAAADVRTAEALQGLREAQDALWSLSDDGDVAPPA